MSFHPSKEGFKAPDETIKRLVPPISFHPSKEGFKAPIQTSNSWATPVSIPQRKVSKQRTSSNTDVTFVRFHPSKEGFKAGGSAMPKPRVEVFPSLKGRFQRAGAAPVGVSFFSVSIPQRKVSKFLFSHQFLSCDEFPSLKGRFQSPRSPCVSMPSLLVSIPQRKVSK